MALQSKSYVRERPSPAVTSEESVALARWVQDEFAALVLRINRPSELRLEPLYAAPTKVRAGMLVYADGTTWNPGSGEGVYRYSLAGAWVFVG